MPRRSNQSTEMEDRILLFIKQVTNEKGYPPSVREICEAVGLASTSTVHAYLIRLEKRNLIRRNVLKPRALEIVDPLVRKEMVSVPIVGKVTAGAPILAVQSISDTFPLPTDFLGDGNAQHFILNVRGDSMIEAGILDGDFVVVRQQSSADNGDIVVAMIDDEATIKRYYKENDAIHLMPENRLLEPIIVKNVEILGRVMGLIRKF